MKNTKVRSISVGTEMDNLSKKHRFSWTEAARIGMALLLADEGVMDYNTELNLYRKMIFYQQEANRLKNEPESGKSI